MKEVSEMNIYEKMSCIENELDDIGKDMTVGKGNNQYKAVGEATVLRAIKPLEEKYRIKSLPIKREVLDQQCFIEKLDTYTKRLFFIRIKTTFKFINLDNIKEIEYIESLGDGTDPLDKASGKAQTYSDKFALLKAYKAVTGEDTDNTHSLYYEESYKQNKPYQPNSKGITGNNEAETMDNVWKNETIKQKEMLDKSFAKAVNIPYASKVKEIVCKSMGWKNWDTDFAITSKADMLNIPQKCKNEIEKLKAIDNSGL